MRRVLAMILGTALVAAVGCGAPTRTAEDAKLADALIGRWTGAAIEPPQHAWFEFGAWDVWFSEGGDFSAVVSTGASNRYKVHLAGAYRLSFGTLYIDQSSLAGKWKVRRENEGPDRDRLRRHADRAGATVRDMRIGAALGLIAVSLTAGLAGCTSVEAEQDSAPSRARRKVAGQSRCFSAEPRGWQGTYEFRESGEVEIHGAWKDPVSGEAAARGPRAELRDAQGRVRIAG